MRFDPQISVILSTYQRPGHLHRSLLSLALQQGVNGQFEVVVTDDGSADRTADVVDRFSRTVDFPVRFVTQEHRGFRLARCRNNGARASRAPYLLFSDGDCLFPVNHLQQHLRARRMRVVQAGNCYRLNEPTAHRIDEAAIISGKYQAWVPAAERRRIRRRSIKDSFYGALGHRRKPKLIGCNIAMWRRNFEMVNGFDEQFIGWGCEDDDLAQRLRAAGIRIVSILRHTRVYHMWHPHDPSRPAAWAQGSNVAYLQRPVKPIRCLVGLVPNTSGEFGQSMSTPNDAIGEAAENLCAA